MTKPEARLRYARGKPLLLAQADGLDPDRSVARAAGQDEVETRLRGLEQAPAGAGGRLEAAGAGACLFLEKASFSVALEVHVSRPAVSTGGVETNLGA